MIYLATPYTHPNNRVRAARFEAAARISARLIEGGLLVFSPITHSHPINEAVGGRVSEWKFWQEFDTKMLDVCDDLVVVKMAGWRESVGIRAEINYMASKGKNIQYIQPLPTEDVNPEAYQ